MMDTRASSIRTGVLESSFHIDYSINNLVLFHVFWHTWGISVMAVGNGNCMY